MFKRKPSEGWAVELGPEPVKRTDGLRPPCFSLKRRCLLPASLQPCIPAALQLKPGTVHPGETWWKDCQPPNTAQLGKEDSEM